MAGTLVTSVVGFIAAGVPDAANPRGIGCRTGADAFRAIGFLHGADLHPACTLAAGLESFLESSVEPRDGDQPDHVFERRIRGWLQDRELMKARPPGIAKARRSGAAKWVGQRVEGNP